MNDAYAAARLDDWLSQFDGDVQERILRYALDHVVPRMKRLTETQRSSHTAESDEESIGTTAFGHPYVGVRVGATPEPTDDECERLWTLHCALGDEHVHPHSIHRYTDAVRRALGTVVYQCPRCSTSMEVDPSAKPAALRAPEPLTAALRSIQHIAENDLRGWSDWDRVASMCRAALEGGVSPQPSSSVHQTENAGEAVQRPVDVPLSGTTTIPLGTLVGHDMAHFRWPANKDAPTNPDTEFEIQLSNNDMFVRLTADGFGAKGAYRNGALLVSRPEWERSWIAASGNVATARSDKTEIEGGVSRTDLCTLCNALIVPRNPTHYDPEDMKAAKVRAALLVSRTEPALTDELCAGLLACAEMLRPHLEAEARSDDYAVSKSANRRLDGLRHYEQIARRGPK